MLAQALAELGQSPKMLYTNHDLAIGPVDAGFTFFQYLVDKVDAITAISQESYEALHRNLPNVTGKLVLIRNGVPLPPISESRESNPRSVFSFGRLSPEKGFDILIRAWAQLKADGYELIISGEGGELSHLKRLATNLCCESSIIFTGWLSEKEVGEILDQCAFVVIPSTWSEPFGLAAAEAQARGRAVIASDTGGLSEIVVDSVTGLLVPAGNIGALTDAMSELISNPLKTRNYGRAGRERMVDQFDFETCTDEFESLYYRLLGD
jgi:glycosyltransferase involved in cell wall biosynthesis